MLDGMHLSALVTVLAILVYFAIAMNVGRMRHRHGIKAPIMTGHPEFERAVRVHMNTLEAMPIFLPALWLTTLYFGGQIPAALGVVWVIGRLLYMQGYMKDPDKRGLGFGVQMLAQLALVVLALIGILR